MYGGVKANSTLKITDCNKYDTATPTFEIPNIEIMQELMQIREQAFQASTLAQEKISAQSAMFKKEV